MLAIASVACGGAGTTGSTAKPPTELPPGGVTTPAAPPTSAPSAAPGATPTPSPAAGLTPAPVPTPALADSRLHVPQGFVLDVIAHVGGARQLAALPNGDLLVGTEGNVIAIVPNADGPGVPGAPVTFATIRDAPVQGVAPNPDGDVHLTTSVAVSGNKVFAGVGSSCNACTEADPTRASVQVMGLDGSGMTTQAKRLRNAIALTTAPVNGNVWAGDAGQDRLPFGHPYEFMDPVSIRPMGSDYGWPACEENHVAYTSGADCTNVIVPVIEFPAYSTLISAAFYPASQTGTYAFPSAWRGGLYVSAHGSWHKQDSIDVVPPHVAFVPFTGPAPARSVDDNTGAIFRIRPANAASSGRKRAS